MPALADDSGLEVTALGGAPGIYSARWAGEPRDFYAAMAEVECQILASGSTDRSARFVCVLALVLPDGTEQVFEGFVSGDLIYPPRGDHGFGYDPVFIAKGQNQTFAEMDPDKKHEIGHRADAFRKFVAAILS